MKKIFTLALLALTACAGQESASSRHPSSGSGYWNIDMLVNGDESCPPRKPEHFSLRIADVNSTVLGVTTISDSIDHVLQAFDFTDTEKKLIDAGNLREAFARAYDRRFSPPNPVTVRVLKNVKSASFSHNVPFSGLIDFQEWHQSLINALKSSKLNVGLANPYLIFGPVSRTGQKPNFKVSFDPDRSVLSAGAQNEAHDTTLCQLRKGIFKVEEGSEADIAIERFVSIQPER
ncbi:MAG: hypothetical protein ACXWQO_02585 [Bdellovibrionota bacterium]